MNKFSLMASVGAAVVLASSLASAQSIVINGPAGTSAVLSVPADSAISAIADNAANVTASVIGVTATSTSVGQSSADAEINENTASALTVGNDVTNEIDTGESGDAPSNVAAIANLNRLTGTAAVLSSVAAVNFVIDGVGGSVTGDSDLEVNENTATGSADGNLARNTISGDFDDLEALAAPADFNIDGNATTGVVNTSGNFMIGNVQFTGPETSVTSTMNDVDFSVTGFTTGGVALLGFPDGAEVNDNEASTQARGNTAFNTIAGSNDGDPNGFGISSLQVNNAPIVASTTNILMNVAFSGAQNIGADVSQNVVSATAGGNVVVNRISFAD